MRRRFRRSLRTPDLPSSPSPEIVQQAENVVPRSIAAPASVNRLQITPDGRFIAAACETNIAVHVYEWLNASLRSSNSSHQSSIRSITLSDDGVCAASGDYDGLVSMWNARSGRLTSQLLLNTTATTLTLTTGGDTLISGAHDGDVRVWDALRGRQRRSLSYHADSVSSCHIDVTGHRVLTSSLDGVLCEWDMRVESPVARLTIHGRQPIYDCNVDQHWRTYLSVGSNKAAVLTDVRMRRTIYSLTTPEGALGCCTIAGNGSRCAIGGSQGSLYMWNTANEKSIQRLSGHEEKTRVTSVSINTTGEKLVSGAYNGSILLWKLERVPAEDALIPLPGDEGVAVSMSSAAFEHYLSFMNRGTPIDAAHVRNALIFDDDRKALTSLVEVVAVHLLIKTLLRTSNEFDALFGGDRVLRNRFLYFRLYHRVAALVGSERELEFGERLLDDAHKLGILEAADVNSILGDAKVLHDVGEKLSKMHTVYREVMVELSGRIDSVEERVAGITKDISELREEMTQMALEREREARIRRWAMVVKLGASFVPLAGSIVTGIVDASCEVFLSFDAESLVEVITDTFSFTVQAAADVIPEVLTSRTSGEQRDQHMKDINNVRLAQVMTSEQVLNSSSEEVGSIRNAITGVYGGDVSELSQHIEAVLTEHRQNPNDSSPVENEGPAP